MAEQSIFGGTTATPSDGSMYLGGWDAGRNWGNVGSQYQQIISANGKLYNLYVEQESSPGTSNARNYWIDINGTATALEANISGVNLIGSNTLTQITVNAGDTIKLGNRDSAGNPADPVNIRWAFIFSGANAGDTIILGATNNVNWGTGSDFANLNGNNSPTAAVNKHRGVVTAAGSIKNLYVSLSAAPSTGSRVFQVLKNGDEVGLMVVISTTDTTGSNTGSIIGVSIGDLLTLRQLRSSAATANATGNWGLTFTANTDGEALVLGGIGALPSSTAKQYIHFSSNGNVNWAAIAAETDRTTMGNSGVQLSNFYIVLDGAPGGGSRVYQSVINGASGNLVINITGNNTTGSDYTNTDNLVNFDNLALQHTPSPGVAPSTPGSSAWGFRAFIPLPSAAAADEPNPLLNGFVSIT